MAVIVGAAGGGVFIVFPGDQIVGWALIALAGALFLFLIGWWGLAWWQRRKHQQRSAEPLSEIEPIVPTAIRFEGGGKLNLKNNTYSGWQRDVHVTGGGEVTSEGDRHLGPIEHRMIRRPGLPLPLDPVQCTCGWDGVYQDWDLHRRRSG